MKTDTRVRHGGLAGLCRSCYDADGPSYSDLAAFTRRKIVTVDIVGITDVRAFVVECDDRIVVCFRGTMFENRRSTLRNLSASTRQEFGQYRVHNGFADGLNDVYSRLVDRVHEARDTLKRPLTITGHSQGGAFADIFAVRLMAAALRGDGDSDLRADQLITFAAPRSGDSAFAAILGLIRYSGSEVVRYTNTNDIVPRLPPYTKGFRHGVDETYLTRDARALPSPWGVYRYYDGLLDRLATATVWDTVHGHSIIEYERKLNLVEAQR